ncbi:mitochondrial nucleoid-associated protein 1 isoform X2 [Tenrec ecaudatus]
MSNLLPTMELCPHCQKPFKRLKSHLPHCKMRGRPTSAAPQVCGAEGDRLWQASRKKGPAKLTRNTEDTRRDREGQGRMTPLIKGPGGVTKTPAPLAAEKTSQKGADKHIRGPDLLAPKIPSSIPSSSPLQDETKAHMCAMGITSPQKELAGGGPESGDGRQLPSETRPPLPVGPRKASSPDVGRIFFTGFPGGVQAPPAHLPSQEFPVKPSDVALGDQSSAPNLSPGVRAARTCSLSSSRGPEPRDGPSEVSSDGRNPEAGPLLAGLGIHPGGRVRVEGSKEVMAVSGRKEEELVLGLEAHEYRGRAESCPSPREARAWSLQSSGSRGPSAGSSATEKQPQASGPSLSLSTLRGSTRTGTLTVSPSRNPSLASLTVTCLQGERAGAPPFTLSKALPSGGPRAARQAQAVPTGHQQPRSAAWHHVRPAPFPNPATATKTPPSSVGLEWFPELYPGYLGLGVLPEKPQYWKVAAQKPRLRIPMGESLSQVPLLQSRLTDPSIWGPPTWPSAPDSLLRLLGALQKGWTRCSSTVQRSSMAGITVLFSGSLVLWCSWSLRHLKQQRWRR